MKLERKKKIVRAEKREIRDSEQFARHITSLVERLPVYNPRMRYDKEVTHAAFEDVALALQSRKGGEPDYVAALRGVDALIAECGSDVFHLKYLREQITREAGGITEEESVGSMQWQPVSNEVAYIQEELQEKKPGTIIVALKKLGKKVLKSHFPAAAAILLAANMSIGMATASEKDTIEQEERRVDSQVRERSADSPQVVAEHLTHTDIYQQLHNANANEWANFDWKSYFEKDTGKLLNESIALKDVMNIFITLDPVTKIEVLCHLEDAESIQTIMVSYTNADGKAFFADIGKTFSYSIYVHIVAMCELGISMSDDVFSALIHAASKYPPTISKLMRISKDALGLDIEHFKEVLSITVKGMRESQLIFDDLPLYRCFTPAE